MAQQQPGRRLRRNIGILGNFAFGYADVAEGIYFTLGLVIIYAGAAATLAYLFATIAYVLTALCYAELATLYHQAGGAFVYARRAFGQRIAFLAAWALLLDYVVTTAISALSAIGYLGYFIPQLNSSLIIGLATAAAIILLMGLNIFGISESAKFSYFLVLFNLAGMALVLITGYAFSFKPGLNTFHFGTSPTYPNFLYAITIAMSSYLGIEVISQSAGETRRPAKNIPRAVFLISTATVLAAIAVSTLAVGGRSVADFSFQNSQSVNSPLSFLVQAFPNGQILAGLVSFMGMSVLLVAANAGIVGSSRITYAMSEDKAIPTVFGRLHKRHNTPWVSIIIFSSVSVAIAFSGELDFAAQLYNFGALLAYVIVGLSLISLRNTDRALFRPFKAPGSISIRPFWRRNMTETREKYTIPITGVLCVVADLVVWLLVVILHPLGRVFGSIWMGLGLLLFFAYTRFRKEAVDPAPTV